MSFEHPSTESNNFDEQERIAALAGDIAQAAGTQDPTQVTAYMDRVLADTTGEVADPEQRSAVLGLLAHEQRQVLFEDQTKTGFDMVDRMVGVAQQADQPLGRASREASNAFSGLAPAYRGAMRRFTEGPSEHGAARRAHDRFTDATVRDAARSLSGYRSILDGWGKAQMDAAKPYDTKRHESEDHMRALRMAKATLRPDYDGEPKDLARVIDADVKATVANRVVAAIIEAEAAGQSPQEAVAALLTETEESKPPRIIGALDDFARLQTQRIARFIGDDVPFKNAGRALSRFGDGAAEYSRARDPRAVEGVVQEHSRALGRINSNVEELIRTNDSVIRGHKDALGAMLQQKAELERAARAAEQAAGQAESAE